jgi:hypothetical protein
MMAKSDDGGSAASADSEDDKELKSCGGTARGRLCAACGEAEDFGNNLFFTKLRLREFGILHLVAPHEVGDEETEECAMRGLGYPG